MDKFIGLNAFVSKWINLVLTHNELDHFGMIMG